MFYYCEKCRKEHGWPDKPCKARGNCGMCRRPASLLHRVTSKTLLKTPLIGWEREESKIPQKEIDEEDLS